MSVSRLPKIPLAIVVLFFLGIALSAQMLVKQEERKNLQDTLDKGTYLVSLISLYPLDDFTPERRSFFLRSLAETTSQGLLYLFVHNEKGQSLLSVAPGDFSGRIPDTVLTRSINTMSLIHQSYRPPGLPYTVHEFSKPILERGRKAGTVRLGLKVPAVLIFSSERISLLATITFFIFAALCIAYYGMTTTLRSLKTRYRRMLASSGAEEPRLYNKALQNSQKIMPILEELEGSLNYTNTRLNEIKEDNIRLMSKLGVTSFEKNQLLNVLDSINAGIIIMDLQDHITFINEYMAKLMDQKRENVINRRLCDAFPQGEIADLMTRYELADSLSVLGSIETTFAQAPGEFFQVSLSHLSTGERTAIGKMISVRNVTGIRMAKRAQQEFTAHVSHELMTSLTNIRAYSEMLMDGEVENPEMQKEFYNTINQETMRLTSIIQNLLNISKMEMGNLTLNKALVRTDSLVEDCVTTIEAAAESKEITIDVQLPDVFPSFMADKELLKTAIINILGNAVKYTPESGKVTFSMEERSGAIVFDIADTGYGISKEDLPHIFEKFYRSSNPQVTNEVGTGLGLSIAHEIVHLHDGDIEVQSKPGEGTRFTMRIPKEEYSIGKS
jgi:PAS domain S-box-containing protein